MEVARLNAAGGIDGRQVEVVIVDDATDPAKAQAATTKLIEQDKVVAVIGATGTGQTMAMRGDIDRAGIPQVSVAGGTVITADRSTSGSSRRRGPTRSSCPFTLKRLQAAGITKIGVIADSGGFGKDGVAVLKAEAPKFGMTVVSEQLFNPGDTDMTGQLTKIKSSGAQAVVMWTAGSEAATIAKNVQQLKLTIPLVGSHGNARTGVHHRRRRGGRGLHLRGGQDPRPRLLRGRHRGVQGRDGFHQALHRQVRQGARHVRGPRVRRLLDHRGRSQGRRPGLRRGEAA